MQSTQPENPPITQPPIGVKLSKGPFECGGTGNPVPNQQPPIMYKSVIGSIEPDNPIALAYKQKYVPGTGDLPSWAIVEGNVTYIPSATSNVKLQGDVQQQHDAGGPEGQKVTHGIANKRPVNIVIPPPPCECVGNSPSTIEAKGWPSELGINGSYSYNGTVDGAPSYTNGSWNIFLYDGSWHLTTDGAGSTGSNDYDTMDFVEGDYMPPSSWDGGGSFEYCVCIQ